jgi:hypothetical protein
MDCRTADSLRRNERWQRRRGQRRSFASVSSESARAEAAPWRAIIRQNVRRKPSKQFFAAEFSRRAALSAEYDDDL